MCVYVCVCVRVRVCVSMYVCLCVYVCICEFLGKRRKRSAPESIGDTVLTCLVFNWAWKADAG